MTLGIILALAATVLPWIGWIAAFRAVVFAVKLVYPEQSADIGRLFRALGISAFVSAMVFIAGLFFKGELTPGPGAYRLPLIWFAMPYSAWLAAISIVMGISRLFQAYAALNEDERFQRLKASAIWGLAALIFIALYTRDPESKIVVLKGAIPFTLTTLAIGIGLAVAAIVAMVSAGRSAKGRGWSKGIVSQIALIIGSIIFGLPFAYAVVTSFKEDRDMSSANGIVWIPKVQETVPFFDPRDPLFEGQYEGSTIQGTIIETKPNGLVKVDIFKPMAIRGTTFETKKELLKAIPKDAPLVSATFEKTKGIGIVVSEDADGRKFVRFLEPASLKDKEAMFEPAQLEPIRKPGLRWQNYTEALSFLPPETQNGLVYLKNTLFLVVMSVIGTILSSSIVAYAFSRMRFPGQKALFAILLSTMMLPAAVTLLPQFLIFRKLGWIDTLYPLWVPAFFGSAFNIFLLRQFFLNIPMELEDAAKIDGCSYWRTFWGVMMPQIKPALAVIAIWTLMGAWNNFMGPLIYVNSPEQMPLSYALQLFQGDRAAEPGLLMAFATLCMLPVLVLFFFAQRYFIEGVTLSGLGGR